MSANPVGLDIGSTAVRAVELKVHRRGKPTLSHSYEILLPPGAVVRGEIIDAEAVSSALKHLWAEGGFKGKKVVLGAGNQSVLVRNLTVPKIPLKHIRKSLPFYVQNILQVPINDCFYDFYPTSESVGERGPVINGLLVAAGKKGILDNIAIVEGVGLTPIEVEITPFALNRILENQPEMTGTVALIDVGANTTSIVVSTNGIPSFTRIISTGGDNVTLALHEGLDIGIDSANHLKRSLKYQFQEVGNENIFLPEIKCACEECLLKSPTTLDPRTHEILRTVIDELLSALRNTIKYVNSLHPQEPITQILLTGGGSQLAGITEALGEITEIPIENFDPLASFTLSQKKNTEKLIINPCMTVALGLALRCTS